MSILAVAAGVSPPFYVSRICYRLSFIGNRGRRNVWVRVFFLIAGWDDIGTFHHQNHGALRRTRAMPNSFRNNEALARPKIDDSIFEIDQEVSVQNKEKLVDVFMFVPMIFALEHAQPYDRIIHSAKRLVVPFVSAGVD